MSEMKRYIKYIIWIILFFAFSEILIHFGLKNNTEESKQTNTVNNTVVNEQTNAINNTVVNEQTNVTNNTAE